MLVLALGFRSSTKRFPSNYNNGLLASVTKQQVMVTVSRQLYLVESLDETVEPMAVIYSKNGFCRTIN